MLKNVLIKGAVAMNKISEKLRDYLKETVVMGDFILKKQCLDLGINPENISEENLKDLADRISKASEMFLGYENSLELKACIERKDFMYS